MQIPSARAYDINAHNLHQLQNVARQVKEKRPGEEGAVHRIRARVEREMIKAQPHKGNLINIRI
ncbi:MAG: hypothetical protein GY859_05155 [Desulfobacterales bacterium]|nr:hypothetical protein [Desulfobacterales bacterium]